MIGYTPRLHTVLERAATEAKHTNVGAIGVEHVFLAILDEVDSIPTQVLRKLKVLDEIRAELQRVLESEAYHTPSREIYRRLDEPPPSD
jgi:ATP-dependent Clp protease ATP-binding subunit ClpA